VALPGLWMATRWQSAKLKFAWKGSTLRNRQGERTYHMPGGLSYAKVNMAAPGKRWFCTEVEAEAAGWRPAKR
jgi:hypothetical protein